MSLQSPEPFRPQPTRRILQGPVDFPDQPVPVLLQRAPQSQIIGSVVAPEDATVYLQASYDLPQLTHIVHWIVVFEIPAHRFSIFGGMGPQHQGKSREITRAYSVQ